ncbi:hypothetical protein K501DRAFT_273016 [Backusella circina FSU 941]|nr:hypothetical protein K501DRAFT_273016 [Backusella circina FSU 941]
MQHKNDPKFFMVGCTERHLTHTSQKSSMPARLSSFALKGTQDENNFLQEKCTNTPSLLIGNMLDNDRVLNRGLFKDNLDSDSTIPQPKANQDTEVYEETSSTYIERSEQTSPKEEFDISPDTTSKYIDPQENYDIVVHTEETGTTVSSPATIRTEDSSESDNG